MDNSTLPAGFELAPVGKEQFFPEGFEQATDEKLPEGFEPAPVKDLTLPLPEQFKKSWTPSEDDPESVYVDENDYKILKGISDPQIGKSTFFSGITRPTDTLLPTFFKSLDEISKDSQKYPGLKELKISELTKIGLSDEKVAEFLAKSVARTYGDGSPEAIKEAMEFYNKTEGAFRQLGSGLLLGIADRIGVDIASENIVGTKHFPVKDYLASSPEDLNKIKTWLAETSKAKKGEFSKEVSLFNGSMKLKIESGDTLKDVNKKIMTEAMYNSLNEIYEISKNPSAQLLSGLVPTFLIGLPFRAITAIGKTVLSAPVRKTISLGAEELAQATTQALSYKKGDFGSGFVESLVTSGMMMSAVKGLETIGKNLGKLPKSKLHLPKAEDTTIPKVKDTTSPKIDEVVPPKAEEVGRSLDVTPEAEQAFKEANKGISIEGARNKDVLNIIAENQATAYIEVNPSTSLDAARSRMLKIVSNAVEHGSNTMDSTGNDLLINNTKEFQNYLKSKKSSEILGHEFASSAERAEPLHLYGKRAIRNLIEPVALETDILSEASKAFKGNKYLADLAEKESPLFTKTFDLSEISREYKSNAKQADKLKEILSEFMDEGDVYVDKDSLINKLNTLGMDEVTAKGIGLKADAYNELVASNRKIAAEVAHNAQWFREINNSTIKNIDGSESGKLATNLVSSKNKANIVTSLLRNVSEAELPSIHQEILSSVTENKPISSELVEGILEAAKDTSDKMGLDTFKGAVDKYNAEINKYSLIQTLAEKAKQGNLFALQRASILKNSLMTQELKLEAINTLRSLKDDWVKNLPKSWDDVKKQEVFDHLTKDSHTKAIEILNDPKKALIDVKDLQTELKIYKYFGEDYLKTYQKGLEDILGKKIDTNYIVAKLINPTNNYDKSGIIKKDILRLAKNFKDTTKSYGPWDKLKNIAMFSTQRERAITKEAFVGLDASVFANQHDDIRLGRQEFEVFVTKKVKPILEKFTHLLQNEDFNKLEKLIAGTDITNREFISTVSKEGKHELTWFGSKLKEILLERANKATKVSDIKNLLSGVDLDESTTLNFKNIDDLSQYIYDGFFPKDVGLSRDMVRAAFELDYHTKLLNWESWKKQGKIIESQNAKYGRNYSTILWRENYITAKKVSDDLVYNDFREIGLLGTKNEFYKTLGSSGKGQLKKLDEIPLDQAMNFTERVFNQAKYQLVGGYSMHSNIELDGYARLTSDMGHTAASKFVLSLLSSPTLSKLADVRIWLRDLDEKLTDTKYLGNPYQIAKNFGNLVFNPISAILLRPIGLTADVIASGLQTMASQGIVTGTKQIIKQTPNLVTSYFAPIIALTKLLTKGGMPTITGNNARELAVNKVLLGTRDIQNVASLYKTLEVSRRKNDIAAWINGWENKQDAVFAFLNNNIKEYSEQKITKTVLNAGYSVLENLNLILKSDGAEAGRKYLSKEMRLVNAVDIDRLVRDVEKRGMDAYASFLPAYRDNTLGRFGRGALSSGLRELSQIFPGATQFVSAIGMLPMNLIEAGGQAKDKIWTAISRNKELSQLSDAGRWSLVTMGGTLLFVEGMAQLARDGLPDSFVDKLYEQDNDNSNNSFMEHFLRHGITGGVDPTSVLPLSRTLKTIEGAYESLTTGAKGTSYGKLTLGISEPTKLFRILGDAYDYFKFNIYKSGVEDLDQDMVLNIAKKTNPQLVKQFESDPNNVELLLKINEEAQANYKQIGFNALQKWFETSPIGFISDYIENPKNFYDFVMALKGDFERANAIKELKMIDNPQYNMLKQYFYNMGLGESFESGDFLQMLNQFGNNMANWGLLDKKTGGSIAKRYQDIITKEPFEFKRLPKYKEPSE